MNTIKEFEGTHSPLGLSFQGRRANFALYSQNASKVYLLLFPKGIETPKQEIPMRKTGNVWHIALENLPPETRYAFRCFGQEFPHPADLFNTEAILADPRSYALDTAAIWGEPHKRYLSYAEPLPPFDWQKTARPRIPGKDLIIYEMHVRGFTKHPSSDSKYAGTFLGVVEKIPHLKKLGINAVELMPIFEFDEIHSKDIQPHTGEPLPNYWGYNSLFFMAPMKRYAFSPEPFAPIQECKMMIRELHKNGIEVILDVVYNHTGEGNEKNYFVNFRGIDNQTYYMTDPEGHYRNFTGCGNTFHCNHPAVQDYIIDSLTFWIDEMHVDGFRFDLASIFTRNGDGSVLDAPPIVQKITRLAQEKNIKIIAEAWDAAGLYQVGLFPNQWKTWSDWNGKYRDVVRRFIKGSPGYTSAFADALCGSESVYHPSKTPLSSINFITAHDGYTLRDLVTYQMKHNYENGEMNQDGNNQNDSWNCGAEGPTIQASIAALREKQMRNFFLALFLSQGIPMLLMGDEYGHSRKGNNNPFVQDNEINWFLWNLLEKNEKIALFTSALIHFRKKHDALRSSHFLSEKNIEWHGIEPFQPHWNGEKKFLSFLLKGSCAIYIAFNAEHHKITVHLPQNLHFRKIVDTNEDWDVHFLQDPANAPRVQGSIEMQEYSAVLLIVDEKGSLCYA